MSRPTIAGLTQERNQLQVEAREAREARGQLQRALDAIVEREAERLKDEERGHDRYHQEERERKIKTLEAEVAQLGEVLQGAWADLQAAKTDAAYWQGRAHQAAGIDPINAAEERSGI